MKANGNPMSAPPDEFGITGEAPYGNLWSSIWRRKSLLAFGIVVVIAAGALHYSRLKPVYESRAQVLVVKKQADAGMPQGSYAASYVEDYVSAHATLIKSPLIVTRAVNEGRLSSLPSLAGVADPAGRIIGALSVARENSDAPAGASNILNLTYRGPAPADCRAIVAAIIESYERFLDETFQTVNKDTLELLTKKAEVLRQELSDKETLYREFRQQKPLLPAGPDGTDLQQSRLAAIESEISELRIRRAETNARLQTIASARRNEKPEVVLALISEWRKAAEPDAVLPPSSASQLASLEEQLLPLRIREQNLLERYGREHPEVQAVVTEIELRREVYERAAAAAEAAIAQTDGDSDSRPDPVTAYVRSLEQQITEADASERALAELLAEERGRAQEVADSSFEDSRQRDEIDRAEKYYDTLLNQLQGIDLGKDLGGYTTSIIAPPADGIRVEPSLYRVMVMAAVLGLFAGLGLVWLAEVTDKSFRNPEEIRRRLGVPVIGHIPLIKSNRKILQSLGQSAQAPEPALVALHRPRSLEAEAFRGLRTSLYFSTRGGHKVIQVTSPESGDGKTTLAANLAVSIAQSGKRVLLVDCDFRKPRQHELFAVPNHIGLASVIADSTEPQDAIFETSVPGLSLLPCGPQPPNPAELLTSPRFEELLQVLREQFDFVVVDSPPLLAVSDPSIIAARVDGVLLTLRATKHGRPKAERAAEILDAMGATISGIAVNGLGPQGAYGHGYGYGGGYGYGYGYGGNGDGSPPSDAPNGSGDANGNAARRLRSSLRSPGAPAQT
jgi:capsular exopolysaccharide synthesis family protein